MPIYSSETGYLPTPARRQSSGHVDQSVSGSSRFQVAYQTSSDRDRGAAPPPARYMDVAPMQYIEPQSSVTKDFKVEDQARYPLLSPLQTRPPAPPASSPMHEPSRRYNPYQSPPQGSAPPPPPRSLPSNDWYSPTYRSRVPPADYSRISTLPAPTSPDIPRRPDYPRRASEATYPPSYPERVPEGYPIPQSHPPNFVKPGPSSPAIPCHRSQHQRLQHHPLSPPQSAVTFSSQSPCPSESSSDQFSERPAQRRRTTPSSVSSYERSISFEPDDRLDGKRPRPPRSRHTKESPGQKAAAVMVKGRPKSSSIHDLPYQSASFSTFMVNPSPSTYEPVGATYMSTVNFQSDNEIQAFDHGPTDLPPRQYLGGPDALSPWKPRKNLGTIPGSALDYLPILEDRVNRLERAVRGYLEYRGQLAVKNATLPGLDDDDEMDEDADAVATNPDQG